MHRRLKKLFGKVRQLFLRKPHEGCALRGEKISLDKFLKEDIQAALRCEFEHEFLLTVTDNIMEKVKKHMKDNQPADLLAKRAANEIAEKARLVEDPINAWTGYNLDKILLEIILALKITMEAIDIKAPEYATIFNKTLTKLSEIQKRLKG